MSETTVVTELPVPPKTSLIRNRKFWIVSAAAVTAAAAYVLLNRATADESSDAGFGSTNVEV